MHSHTYKNQVRLTWEFPENKFLPKIVLIKITLLRRISTRLITYLKSLNIVRTFRHYAHYLTSKSKAV